MPKSFIAIVEGKSADFTKVAPHEFEQEIKWEGDRVPDLLKLPDGSLLMHVARYATAGEQHCYRRPLIVDVDAEGNASQ